MMTPQQCQKLLILFLMLASDSVSNVDIANNLAAIQDLVNDVPKAINVLNTWRNGSNPAYNNDRGAAKAAVSDFLSTTGNGWGGGGNCPHDIGTMMQWLKTV
jgi:hypothetical protein